MAPLSKETADISTPAGDSAASEPSASTKQASNPARSDALSLDIPVKVHGSRVTQVVLNTTPHTEPFEEQTSTMIIFPQGAVLRMSTAVDSGQMLVLTNLRTRQDAICRVVKARPFSNQQAYVEIEFTHKQPGYWGVHFPSEDAATPGKEAAPAPAGSSEAKQRPVPPPVTPSSSAPSARQTYSPGKTNMPAQPPPRPATPPRVAAAHPPVADGKPEKVEPLATTPSPADGAVSAETKEAASVAEKKSGTLIPFPSPQQPPPPALPSMNELQGDSQPQTFLAQAEESAEDIASFSETAPRSTSAYSGGFARSHDRPASSGALGVRVDASAVSKLHSEAVEPRQNWVVIVLCIALLFVGLAGGIFLLHHRSAGTTSAAVHAPAPSSPMQPADTPLGEPLFAEAAQPSSPPTAAPSPASTHVTPNIKTLSKSPVGPERPVSPAQQQPTLKVVPDMSSTLTAHPVARKSKIKEGAEMALSVPGEVAPATPKSDSLTGILASGENAAPPPPEVTPEIPAKVGGQVKEPRLISSVLPVYPVIAKTAGIQGDVVIEAVIDKSGTPTNLKLISGPAMLRQAALAALRRWKYEPSRLNGEPIAVKMLVTIKFRR